MKLDAFRFNALSLSKMRIKSGQSYCSLVFLDEPIRLFNIVYLPATENILAVVHYIVKNL